MNIRGLDSKTAGVHSIHEINIHIVYISIYRFMIIDE